jgi:hypothetical protein
MFLIFFFSFSFPFAFCTNIEGSGDKEEAVDSLPTGLKFDCGDYRLEDPAGSDGWRLRSY